MDLYEKIIAAYPELETGIEFSKGIIVLRDDSDEIGAYIEEWNYEQPVPKGLSVGKPSK